MKTNKSVISLREANQIDLVDYLAEMGYQPNKIRLEEYWYLSPFRNENNASFKVDRSKNIWYDHGEGIGGKLIDFGIRYYHCQLPELLAKLSCQFPFQQQIKPAITISTVQSVRPLKIREVHPVNSLDLFQYLKTRRIDFHMATTYCHEICFETGNKTGKALGFPNDQGGYELRNSSFKASVSPKAVTTLRNKGKQLAVFEGFFDFLSFKSIHQNLDLPETDFLILNSTAFFEKSRSVMEEYEKVDLFLDHDVTGERCTKLGLSWGVKYRDESCLYTGHKDLNEWVQFIGKRPEKSL